MTDLICKNTMRRCQTPGMCSPFGGCHEVEPVSSVWLEQLRTEFRATVRERDQLKAESEALRKALGEISGQVDGNIRCTVRDVVNGLPDVQDIYGYCDAIDEIIDAALAREVSR